ncbi:MAG: transcriptional repressor [Chloroflexota bacterium]|nr:transcriptional repressor [Chloroflexota bacterium]
MATQSSVVAKATQRLQALGYRLTPQRMMILEEVMGSEEHVTAEDLYEQVKRRYPHISFSTVYRTLEVLRDSGFITQTDLGGGRWQYHPVEKATHHHLVCQGCGSIAKVDQAVLAGLQRELDEEYGFDAILNHFAIFGRCRNCR